MRSIKYDENFLELLVPRLDPVLYNYPILQLPLEFFFLKMILVVIVFI